MARVATWLCVVALAAVAAGPIGAAAAASSTQQATTKKAKRMTCRWSTTTKKSKRRWVCIVHKAKTKTKTKAKANAGTPPTPPPALPPPSAFRDGAPTAAPPPPEADAAVPGAPAGPTPVAPARLQVTAREFTLVLSRPSVAAGALITQLVNRGEDPHDLHLRPAAGGADLVAVAATLPGAVADADRVSLVAGSYTLYCALAGHEAAGMRATLTVA